jgi:hypothetical protein
VQVPDLAFGSADPINCGQYPGTRDGSVDVNIANRHGEGIAAIGTAKARQYGTGRQLDPSGQHGHQDSEHVCRLDVPADQCVDKRAMWRASDRQFTI